MLEYLIELYLEQRIGLICAAMTLVYEIANYCEQYMLQTISMTMSTRSRVTQVTSCPYYGTEEDTSVRQYSIFYFDSDQMALLKYVRKNAPLFSYFIIGVLSDKYGGHRMMFLGLLMSGIVMGTLYLSGLNNFYVFLLLYAVRGFSEGVVWPASASIIGKLAKSDQRTTFCAYLLTAFVLSQFLAACICSLMVNWKTICYTCSVIFFITSILWWILWRIPFIPRITRTINIHWMKILGRVFVVNVYLIQFSCMITWDIKKKIEDSYLTDVFFMRYRDNRVLHLFMCIAGTFTCVACGITADSLLSKKIKLGLSILASYLAVFIMFMGGCDQGLSLVFWITQTIAFTAQDMISMSIIIDVSPTFSGTTYGASILLGYFGSYLLEESLSYLILTDFGDIVQWHKVFYIQLVVATVSVLPYIFFNPMSDGISRDYGLSLTDSPELSLTPRPTISSVDSPASTLVEGRDRRFLPSDKRERANKTE